MKRLCLIMLIVFFAMTFAQESGNKNGFYITPRKLIDSHTAGILPKASFDIETRIYPSGDPSINGAGMLFGFSVGITDRLNLGGSYGGDGIIGRGRARGNPYPGLFIKYRLIEENFVMPAIAIGFDPQGYGGIETVNYKGYIYKSPGFFVAVSKNYLIMKHFALGLHGSVNFSIEEVSTVKWPNVFLGIDFGINEELSFVVEYDLGLNQKDYIDKGYVNIVGGILNAGIRWNIVPNLYFEFDAKDITAQKLYDNSASNKVRLGWSREIKLVYVKSFLD